MVPDINLLPKLEKNQSESKLLYILLGIIVLLVLSYLIWQYFNARKEIVSLQTEETALISQRDALENEVNVNITNNQGSLEQSVEFVELISYPVSTLIDETQRYQPTNSFLRQYSFDVSSISLTIDFETLNELSDYIAKLLSSPYFVDVQVSSITSFDLGPNEGTETEIDFDVIPRHSANIVLVLDNHSLAIGGTK